MIAFYDTTPSMAFPCSIIKPEIPVPLPCHPMKYKESDHQYDHFYDPRKKKEGKKCGSEYRKLEI